MTNVTFEDRLQRTRNRPSGFDYMRTVLATCVVVMHTFLLSYGSVIGTVREGPLTAVTPLVVPMFFALSGFLVAGSFERSNSLVEFFGLRVFRIVPALVTVVLVSALILGPLLTTLPLDGYFRSHEFWSYFLNIICYIHYHLPGVFEGNPNRFVNGQFWTVPLEFACYIAVCLISCINGYRRGWLLIAIFAVLQAAQILNTLFRYNPTYNGPGSTTVFLCFLAGVLFYRFRERVIYSMPLAVLSLALALASVAIPNAIRFAALPIAYLTVCLGLCNPRRDKIVLSGDYSYGIYLYGYPIQQTVVAISPLPREWYWNLLIALPITVFVAYLSWHLIEKRVLSRRKILKSLGASLGFATVSAEPVHGKP